MARGDPLHRYAALTQQRRDDVRPRDRLARFRLGRDRQTVFLCQNALRPHRERMLPRGTGRYS